MVEIDESKCTGCNLCFDVCIGGPIFEGPVVKDKAGFECAECGHCYAICPENAVDLGFYDGPETIELGREPAVDGPTMMALLKGRRSGRLFKDEPVSREDVTALVEAASCAPSAHNAHPVKAYAYYDEAVLGGMERETLAYYRRLLKMFKKPGFPLAWKAMGLDPGELDELKRTFAGLANPVKKDDILTYGAKTQLAFTAPRRNTLAVGDAWIAAQNAVIQAEAMRIACFYNGFMIMAAKGSRGLRKVMGIPRGEKVVAVLTLGYPKNRFRRAAPRELMPTTWR